MGRSGRGTEHGEKHVALARAHLEGAPGPVLDLGCGEGIFSGVSPTYIGVDRSLESARRVRALGRPAVVGDVRWLPFRDGAAGGAVCVNALHLLDDPRGLLREMDRVLGPVSRAYLKNDWLKSPHGRGEAVRRELARWAHRLAYGMHRLFSPRRFLVRPTGRGQAVCPHCVSGFLRDRGFAVRREGRYVLILSRVGPGSGR